MREIWGSVWGEKLWYLLRGMELPEEITARRSVGHSHVMAPELRDPSKAKDVARRLTMKAASRLRRMEYYAGAMAFRPGWKMTRESMPKGAFTGRRTIRPSSIS